MDSTSKPDDQIGHNPIAAPRHPPGLESAIADLLGRIPKRWAEFQPDALSEFESQALMLLIGAEMVERRVRSRARLLNQSVAVKFTITATGEHGIVEAMEPLITAMEDDW